MAEKHDQAKRFQDGSEIHFATVLAHLPSSWRGIKDEKETQNRRTHQDRGRDGNGKQILRSYVGMAEEAKSRN